MPGCGNMGQTYLVLVVPCNGCMEGFPNSQINSSHITFLSACSLEVMSVRDLRTGMLLDSPRPLCRLSSFKGFHGKKVRHQVDQWLTISHVTFLSRMGFPIQLKSKKVEIGREKTL